MVVRIIRSEGISGAFKGFSASMINTFSMRESGVRRRCQVEWGFCMPKSSENVIPRPARRGSITSIRRGGETRIECHPVCWRVASIQQSRRISSRNLTEIPGAHADSGGHAQTSSGVIDASGPEAGRVTRAHPLESQLRFPRRDDRRSSTERRVGSLSATLCILRVMRCRWR